MRTFPLPNVGSGPGRGVLEIVRRFVTLYFAVQGVSIFAWWALLLLVPSSRSFFLPPELGELSLLGFWLADAMAALASLAAAYLSSRRAPSGRPVSWLTAGSMAYSALYCVGVLTLTGSGWPAVILMVPAAALCVAGAWVVSRD